MLAKDLLIAMMEERAEVCHSKWAKCHIYDVHGRREWKREEELAREARALAMQIPEELEKQAKERWTE